MKRHPALWLTVATMAQACAQAPTGFGDVLVDVPAADVTATDARVDVPVDHATSDIVPDIHVDTGADAPMNCNTDRDCHTFERSVCDPTTHTCEHCSDDPSTTRICISGYYCNAARQCTPGCNSDADCSAGDAGTTLHCDTARHACAGCGADRDCQLGSLCSSGECLPGCSATHDCLPGQTCCSGMCLNTNSDITHCGTCSRICSAINGTPTCAQGVCGITCMRGFGDCDGNNANGCEADTLASSTNCGGCGMACTTAHATGGCMAGACVLSGCLTGYQDCNRTPGDGCEADVTSDAANCGHCGRACGPGYVCMSGRCTCPSGLQACTGGDGSADAATSVCANLSTDLQNCGACGHTCSTPYCVNGVCMNLPPLYHGWTSPIAGCLTNSFDSMAMTDDGGFYPYNAADSYPCRAWKLAATICTTQPTQYSGSTANWMCPTSGGFTDPAFGTFCAVTNQYICTSCPGLCNASPCSYGTMSLRNCSGLEQHQP